MTCIKKKSGRVMQNLMNECHVVGNDSIAGGGVVPVSLGDGVATRHTEESGATNNGHLTFRVHGGVLPGNGEGAAIVWAVYEGITKGHDKPNLILTGRPIHSLGPAHKFRLRVRCLC